MALKAKIANKVQTNASGLIEGTILKVLEIDERTEVEKGKEVTYAAQFEFQIEVEGSQKSIIYRVWTRQSFNNEKYKKEDKTEDYNSFTRLMLQLELITESDLKDLDNSKLTSIDVESVEGLKVQFELENSRKNPCLKVPNIKTIKLLKLDKV